MTFRIKTLRHAFARMMDTVGDVTNAVILLVVIGGAWYCWDKAKFYFLRAGVSSLPKDEQGWLNTAITTKLALVEGYGRSALVTRVESWALAWVYALAAVAFSILVVAGCRWFWNRMRDVVAGV